MNKIVLIVMLLLWCFQTLHADIRTFNGSKGYTLDTTGGMPFFLDFNAEKIRNCRFRMNDTLYCVWDSEEEKFSDTIDFRDMKSYVGNVWLYIDIETKKGRIVFIDDTSSEAGKLTDKNHWILLYKLNAGKIEGTGVVRRIDGHYRAQDFSGKGTSAGAKLVSLLIVSPLCGVNKEIYDIKRTNEVDYTLKVGDSTTREAYRKIISSEEYKGNLFLYENLYGEMATSKNTLMMLKTMQRCSDLVIFIYLGHGGQTMFINREYFVLNDKGYQAGRLYDSEFTRTVLSNPRAGGRTLCLLGCCHSGGMIHDPRGSFGAGIIRAFQEEAQKRTVIPPLFLITSATANETALGSQDGDEMMTTLSQWYNKNEYKKPYSYEGCTYDKVKTYMENRAIVSRYYKPKEGASSDWQYDEKTKTFTHHSQVLVLGDWPMNERFFH